MESYARPEKPADIRHWMVEAEEALAIVAQVPGDGAVAAVQAHSFAAPAKVVKAAQVGLASLLAMVWDRG